MPRKPVLLSSLFNLVLRSIAGQTFASSNQNGVLPQRPLPTDREKWHVYWKVQGQSWRTEPEIGVNRREELSKRRAIIADIQQGIYPFKGMKLNRADVEWLLSTHENGRGPVDWSDESQRGLLNDAAWKRVSFVTTSAAPLRFTLNAPHQMI